MDFDALGEWFTHHRRNLPWRDGKTSPWGVLVSEVMLQQTPVARVEPVWREWMSRWPTPADLAESTVADAVRAWGRLGYPRRARNLHQQAQIITQRFSGMVPRDVDTLMELPGIGHYTARAVASFAFGDRHPVADTNVTRVIARVVEGVAFAGHWSPRLGLNRVDEALAHLPDREYLRLNLGIMELGALVCQAKLPQCDRCPLADHCAWRANGFPIDHNVVPKKQASYEGSDRQARGRLLGVLRENHTSVGRSQLIASHYPATQAQRALDSLISDGLVTEVTDTHADEAHFTLAGD